jgi:hypothetical protein
MKRDGRNDGLCGALPLRPGHFNVVMKRGPQGARG